METFAERLRYARHRAKLSQDELSHKVGCTKSTLSKAESGISQEVLMTTLFKIADALMIDPRWLATGKHAINESMVGVPGAVGLNEAFAKLPEDLQGPLRTIIETAAQAAEQRYWKWIAEWDKK